MTNDSSEFSQAEKEALLAQAMENCGAYILSYLTGLCHDIHAAEDLAQDLWFYVYKKFSPLDYEHRGFLKNKARQLCIDKFRAQGTRPNLDLENEVAEELAVAKCPEPSTPEEGARLFTSFWESFEGLNLTDYQKQLFWLNVRCGIPIKEVAEKLGIAKSTAHGHLKLVEKQCREYLTHHTTE